MTCSSPTALIWTGLTLPEDDNPELVYSYDSDDLFIDSSSDGDGAEISMEKFEARLGGNFDTIDEFMLRLKCWSTTQTARASSESNQRLQVPEPLALSKLLLKKRPPRGPLLLNWE